MPYRHSGEIVLLNSPRHGPYLGVTCAYEIVSPSLARLKTSLGEIVSSRLIANQQSRDFGRYHITLITPVEYRDLGLTTEKIKHIGRHAHCVIHGIGVAAGQGNTCYFLVVTSSEMQCIRTSYGLAPNDLHITLGFDIDDVHNVPKGLPTVLWDASAS